MLFLFVNYKLKDFLYCVFLYFKLCFYIVRIRKFVFIYISSLKLEFVILYIDGFFLKLIFVENSVYVYLVGICNFE